MKNFGTVSGSLVRFKILIIILSISSFALAQSVLFEGPTELPSTPADPPASGAGTRMMWYPDKAAFRVGSVLSARWDKDSIGSLSVAWGVNNQAKGSLSTAWGFLNKAQAENSTCWGEQNTTFGLGSTVWGSMNIVRGNHSSAWGTNNIAKTYLETVIGQFNDTLASNNIANFIGADYLFVIGNGQSVNSRSNALEIYKNGNMSVSGKTNLADSLIVTGAAQLNSNLKVSGKINLSDSLTVLGAAKLNNNLSVSGFTNMNGLGLTTSTESITFDDQVVTVGSRGYIRIGATFVMSATDRTVVLSNGSSSGQLLLLEGSLNKWELLDTGNLNLASDHTFNNGDTIQLVWNGTKWLEIHFSDN